MQEKFCGHLRIAYLPEMFDCLAVFSVIEIHLSSGNLANGLRLSGRILCCRLTDRFASSPRTLEVESQRAKLGFAEAKQPRAGQILVRQFSSGSRNSQHFPKLTETQESKSLSTERAKVHYQADAMIHSGDAGFKNF
jgi:hypothetical protein